MSGVRQELLHLQREALRLPVREVWIPPACINRVYEAQMGEAIGNLKSVGVRPATASVQVIFRTTGPVRYTAARTADPARIVIDLLQTGISPVFTRRELLSVHPALVRVLITRAAGSTRAVGA